MFLTSCIIKDNQNNIIYKIHNIIEFQYWNLKIEKNINSSNIFNIIRNKLHIDSYKCLNYNECNNWFININYQYELYIKNKNKFNINMNVVVSQIEKFLSVKTYEQIFYQKFNLNIKNNTKDDNIFTSNIFSSNYDSRTTASTTTTTVTSTNLNNRYDHDDDDVISYNDEDDNDNVVTVSQRHQQRQRRGSSMRNTNNSLENKRHSMNKNEPNHHTHVRNSNGKNIIIYI